MHNIPIFDLYMVFMLFRFLFFSLPILLSRILRFSCEINIVDIKQASSCLDFFLILAWFWSHVHPFLLIRLAFLYLIQSLFIRLHVHLPHYSMYWLFQLMEEITVSLSHPYIRKAGNPLCPNTPPRVGLAKGLPWKKHPLRWDNYLKELLFGCAVALGL
jgi:hypothetical protein